MSPDRHWDYGQPGFTEEGDEELAELYRLISCDAAGLYHEPAEAREPPLVSSTEVVRRS